MVHLIDKDALVAEIKRRMDENSGKQALPQYFGMIEEDLNILSFIDTHEVKEVDLKKEPASEDFESEWKRYCDSKGGGAVTMNLKDVAQHFAKYGYEQDKKDFIKKACFWLECNLSHMSSEDVKFWVEDFVQTMNA